MWQILVATALAFAITLGVMDCPQQTGAAADPPIIIDPPR